MKALQVVSFTPGFVSLQALLFNTHLQCIQIISCVALLFQINNTIRGHDIKDLPSHLKSPQWLLMPISIIGCPSNLREGTQPSNHTLARHNSALTKNTCYRCNILWLVQWQFVHLPLHICSNSFPVQYFYRCHPHSTQARFWDWKKR
jgi:hypothetical protein